MTFLEKFARRLGETENLLAYAESGEVAAISFSGDPKKATVTLSQAQPSASYAVNVTGSDGRFWTIEARTTTGFIINSNASQALNGPVFWSLGGNI